MKYIIHASLFLLCLLGFGKELYADTLLQGDIDGVLHLVESGNPYVVGSAGLSISPSGSLIIDPGVILRLGIEPIVIKGSFSAGGTTLKPITFSSSLTNQRARGVYISSQSNKKYTNINIEESEDGFVFDHSENISFDHVILKNNSKSFTFTTSTSSLKDISLENSPLVDVFDKSNVIISSTTARGSSGFASLYVSNSILELDTCGFYTLDQTKFLVTNSATSSINNCTINNSNQVGITSSKSYVKVLNSSFSHINNDVISLKNSRLEVSSSSFNSNNIGIHILKPITLPGISFLHNISNALSLLLFTNTFAADIFSTNIHQSVFTNNTLAGIKNDSEELIDVSENYWGNDAGPQRDSEVTGGDVVVGNMIVTPWKTKSTPAPCCSSVIFIPGFEASRLYEGVGLTKNQLWEPNYNGDVKKLYLNDKGESLNKNIYTNDIIEKTNIAGGGVLDKEIYSPLVAMLQSKVAKGVIKSFEAFPYDWREDPYELVKKQIRTEQNSYSMIERLKTIASSSRTGKVTIVSHSNGGLVAKALIDELKKTHNENLIESLVLVATPQKGAPIDIGSLLYGDGQEILKGFILSKDTAKGLGKNMISAYNLLPRNLFTPYVTIDPETAKVSKLYQNFSGAITSKEQLNLFLLQASKSINDPTAQTLSNTLLQTSVLTQKKLDAWTPPLSLSVYQIAGSGISTPTGFSYYLKNVCSVVGLPNTCVGGQFVDHALVSSMAGDGTVPLESALSIATTTHIIDLATYNIDHNTNINHSNIFTAEPLLQLASALIERQKVSSSSYVSTFRTPQLTVTSSSTLIEVSVHSPVNLLIEDVSGKKTGIISSTSSDFSQLLTDIPNSSYSEVGEGKYITLPKEKIHKVILSATDYGEFELDIAEKNATSAINNNGLVVFEHVPIIPSTHAELDFPLEEAASSSDYILKVDVDGNGTNDTLLTASSSNKYLPNTSFYFLMLRNMISSFNLQQQVEKKLQQRIDHIQKSFVSTKKEKFQKLIRALIMRLQSETYRFKKISQDDKTHLVTLLESFLSNVENG